MEELIAPPPLHSTSIYDYALPPIDQDASFIRVFLMRRTVVTVRGQCAWRDSVIGEGTLRQLPPYPSQCKSQNIRIIDWEGEVRCGADVKTGGFNAGHLLLQVNKLGLHATDHFTKVIFISLGFPRVSAHASESNNFTSDQASACPSYTTCD